MAATDPLRDLLERVRVVLVGTSHAGNLGACARVMTNMGLRDLVLVAPACAIDGQALAMASGGAQCLQRARIVPELAEAVADVQIVAGTTARPRHLHWRVHDLPEFSQLAVGAARAGQRVAIVFGPERTGLLNEHLACCTELITIDANPEYPSLNLASAVQICCYALRSAARQTGNAAHERDRPPRRQVEAFLDVVARGIDRIGFVDGRGNLPATMQRLRALLGRADPDRRELALLHGIVAKAMGRGEGGRDKGD